MLVCEIMTEDVTCAFPETDVVKAAELMRDRGVGVLPVCDGRRLVGIVTDRDIVIRHVATQRSGETVGAIMTPHPYVVRPEDPVERAESLMAEHKVRRLPVCEEGELVGLISQADLARRASHEAVGALVQAISS